ncbi:MAG TPA: LacI family DNA-binding transcriptional regulator [Polyangiaceae bacterium]|jgi:LacI family transcriptional regulator/LacI family repressor for deo operon, udp, cdd, tsx, nupC, and nupG|nr:LacI family DNA-binding transcriptional regulator [Polyangiaceae bacterium]
MAQSPATIVQVAERASVAVSTVSRVLNGGSASLAVQARVRRAVSELGYQPSLAARNLKLGRSGIIGLAGATTQAPWFTVLLGGMESKLAEHRTSLAIASLERRGRFDGSAVEAWIQSRRVDSIAFVRPGENERALTRLADRYKIAVAYVLPEYEARRGLIIRADNEGGGRQAAAHLLALGHRRIAFFGGPEASVDTQNRLLGLRTRLAEAGLELPAHRTWFAPNYELGSGIVAADIWLAQRQFREATAVVLGNDAMALGFLRRVQAHSLSVPRDVSVVGFDGVPEGEFSFPSLTTVAQPTHACAEDVAQLLLESRAALLSSLVVRSYDLQLVVRESTSPPPTGSNSGGTGN